MKKQLAVLSAFAMGLLSTTSAFAAYTLPTAVTTAFTDMGEAWELIEAQIWPILAVVVIGFFVIRMFKRGAKQVG
jgi:hypothetical protein